MKLWVLMSLIESDSAYNQTDNCAFVGVYLTRELALRDVQSWWNDYEIYEVDLIE